MVDLEEMVKELVQPYQLPEYQTNMRRGRFDNTLGQYSRPQGADAYALRSWLYNTYGNCNGRSKPPSWSKSLIEFWFLPKSSIP